MVQIIAGKMGNGKTKFLLDKANVAVAECKGSIVYLDKDTKSMHELDNKIRLINVHDYPIPVHTMRLSDSYVESFLRITIWNMFSWTAS